MSEARLNLALDPDFTLGAWRVSPSACRVSGPGGVIRVQAQTMAVLVTLVRAGGVTVPREQLIEACWGRRVVSDDAVSRAIAKVRTLAAATEGGFTVETLPKVGYRLVSQALGEAAEESAAAPRLAPWLDRRLAGVVAACGVVAVLVVTGLAITLAAPRPMTPPANVLDAASAPRIRAADVSDALFTLDEDRLQRYLNAGWSPDWHLDSEGNASLHALMQVCERNPTHDQAGVLRVARRLIAAGAHADLANKWGDTPLIIARSPRYCGPGHPVVAFLASLTAR